MIHSSTDATWQTLIRAAGEERFEPALVESVPEPARRYLLHSIAPGTPLSICVELEMEGRFRATPGGKWMPMRAVEMLSFPGGFVWRAEIGKLFKISGHDIYAGGEGQLEWRLWNLFPVMRASGADINRSAAGRLAAEAAAWLPAALLPRFGTRWRAVDDGTAVAALPIDDELFEVTFTIDPSGAVRELRQVRWANHLTPNAEYTEIPSAAVCADEITSGGFTIPSRLTGNWWTGTRREFDFFDAAITHARYY